MTVACVFIAWLLLQRCASQTTIQKARNRRQTQSTEAGHEPSNKMDLGSAPRAEDLEMVPHATQAGERQELSVASISAGQDRRPHMARDTDEQPRRTTPPAVSRTMVVAAPAPAAAAESEDSQMMRSLPVAGQLNEP